MRILLTGRGLGKTNALVSEFIAWPKEAKFLIVTTMVEKKRIEELLRRSGFENLCDRVITSYRCVDDMHGRYYNPAIFIDNIEFVLQDLLHAPVELGTLSS